MDRGPVFIKDVIKGLKDDDGYGVPLILGYREVGELDTTLGTQSQMVKEITIAQAIRLPNRMMLEFLQSVGQLKAMDIPTGTIQILLDLDDVPSWFDLRAGNSYASFGGRKYTVLKSEVYDFAAVVFAKDIGANLPGTTSDSTLRFGHSVQVWVNP